MERNSKNNRKIKFETPDNAKKLSFNERNKSKININLKIAILLIIFAIFSVLIIMLSYKNKSENYQAAETQEYQAITYSNEYKKTSELTDADLTDEYQKNYQETTAEDGSYLIKSAEWTNKQKGEGLITIQGAQVQELQDTSALYVATMCYAHGLTEDILVKNIQTLTKYYTKVDFIAINNCYAEGILDSKTFTKDSTEDEIRLYVSEAKNSGMTYPHLSYSIPYAIQEYLFGNVGDEYINEGNLKNTPTAIYTSFDSFYLGNTGGTTASSGWGAEYGTEKYFNFIKEKYENRYFSMSQYSRQEGKQCIGVRYPFQKYEASRLNVLLGILNPENYGEADLVYSEESLNKWQADNSEDLLELPIENKKYLADYSYSQDFEEAGVQVITNCTITDTMQDYFEIVDVDAKGGSDSMNIKAIGQNVLFYDVNYVCGNEITITIKVKIKQDTNFNFDGFEDTNLGKATLTGNKNISVDSPKLAPATTYTVNYLEKGTNAKLSNAKIYNNIPINAQINASDEVIDIDGYNYDSADKQILILGTEENVINLYYTKRTDLSYKVNYLEKDTNKVLSAQKVVNGQTFDKVINTEDEIITIQGYDYDSANQSSLTIGTGENVINLYYTKKNTSVLVHHYIDGTQNRVPSKNGGEVEDEIISGKVDDQYSTRESSNIANNYELITSKLPENANGIMTENQIVVTYYYQLKDPTLDSNISKNSTLNKVTAKDQEIPYTITYTSNVDTYIGDAEVIIVDTLPYEIDEEKSDVAGGTYDAEAKTITWEENITGIDSFTSIKNQINITKEIKLVYKDLDVKQPNLINKVTGTINLKVPEKTDTAETTKDIPTEYLKDVKITKVWEDNNNTAHKRPTNVTAVLTGDGKTYKQQLSEENAIFENDNNWEYTFINLPKYNSQGEEIDYVLSEELSVEDNNKFYLSHIDQASKIITNTFQVPVENVTIPVTKIWDDNNNIAGKRPTSVTLQVKNGDEIVAEEEVTANEEWKHTFIVPKYDSDGNVINYTIDEKDLNNKYYEKGDVNQSARTITNVSKYGKVTVHYYIEGTTTRVPDINGSEIEDVLIEGKQGESYNTNSAENVKQNYELVTTPTNSNGTITLEDTEVIYYYRLKTPSVTNQIINKTGTDRITVANQEMSYAVTYRAEITDYIGNAEVTIVDTLPYEIDEEKSDLAGGTYNSTDKTITWTENVTDIDSYNGKGIVNITKNFKVVYVGLDMSQEKITNNVKGNIKLLTPEKASEEVNANQESTIYKAIISAEKLVNKTEAIEGEKVTYIIRITNDGNLAKTVTVRDTLPAGITFDNNTLIQVGDIGTVYTEQNLKSGIPVEVPASGSIDVVFAGKVDTLANNEYSKTLTNQATVDNEPTNEVTTNVTKANITAHKESDPASGNKVREGDEITYRIRVRNDGTREGTAIVKDTVPTGTTFVEGSIKIDSVTDTSKTATDLQNGINLTVGKGNESIVEFKVRVNKLIDGTKIKNTAYINQNGEDKKVPEEPEHTYVEPKEEQSISKNGTTTIESLDQEITYNINYIAKITDYAGRATVKVIDTLPYAIDEAMSELAGGTYDAEARTITWEETVEDIQLTEEKEVTINKTIKVVYKEVSQDIVSIKNVVTGHIEYETPAMTSNEVTANATTTTGFTVNIPVSKVWEDDSNKLNQRPTKVVFKLHGSDGSEYTKEMSKPGTQGSTTTQDSTNPNKWNDIFENLPKYDNNNQEIVYTITEEEKTEGDLKYYDSVVTDKTVTNTNKYGKVTVHHYIMNTDGTATITRVPDTNGTEIADVVIEGKEGDPYTTEEANNINEKYELVAEKLPANATGTIEKYNEEKLQEVIYYYRLKPAKVLINYLEKDDDTDDSNNLVLTAQEKIDGHVDDVYNTDTDHRKETIEKDGKTYTLVSDSGNKEGTMTLTDINVTYYYLQNTKATVRYVERDPETGDIVKDLEEPTVKEGLVGDEFVTNSKDFVGYKLVESPEKTTINLSKEEQTLIYYYEPIYTGLIENHIDDKTGKILETETHDIQVGEDYNIPSKEFDVDEEKILKDFIKIHEKDDTKEYKELSAFSKLFTQNAIYESLTLTPEEQLNLVESVLTEKNRSYVEPIIKTIKNFNVLEMLDKIKERMDKISPTIYVYVSGDSNKNYDYLSSKIKTQLFKNMSKGIIIEYKDKLYDYSI